MSDQRTRAIELGNEPESQNHDGYYVMEVYCDNCRFDGEAEIPKGRKVEDAECPRCECTELIAVDHKKAVSDEKAAEEDLDMPTRDARDILDELQRMEEQRQREGRPHPALPAPITSPSLPPSHPDPEQWRYAQGIVQDRPEGHWSSANDVQGMSTPFNSQAGGPNGDRSLIANTVAGATSRSILDPVESAVASRIGTPVDRNLNNIQASNLLGSTAMSQLESAAMSQIINSDAQNIARV